MVYMNTVNVKETIEEWTATGRLVFSEGYDGCSDDEQVGALRFGEVGARDFEMVELAAVSWEDKKWEGSVLVDRNTDKTVAGRSKWEVARKALALGLNEVEKAVKYCDSLEEAMEETQELGGLVEALAKEFAHALVVE